MRRDTRTLLYCLVSREYACNDGGVSGYTSSSTGRLRAGVGATSRDAHVSLLARDALVRLCRLALVLDRQAAVHSFAQKISKEVEQSD